MSLVVHNGKFFMSEEAHLGQEVHRVLGYVVRWVPAGKDKNHSVQALVTNEAMGNLYSNGMSPAMFAWLALSGPCPTKYSQQAAG